MRTIEFIKHKVVFIFSILLLLFVVNKVYGQSNKVPFSLRTSIKAPEPYKNQEIYNLRGDFTMIGNANLFDKRLWSSGSPGDSNVNTNMAFYKLTGDPSSIRNSSSATLVHPAGFDSSCTKIVYVGLYWSGRGDNTNSNVLSNGLRKDKVKLRLPGSTSYQELTAEWIYRGDSDSRGIYSSYIDITDKILTLGSNAWGTYSVADIATRPGEIDNTGLYGGWGMVVIYENPLMKWRDITVYDGFSVLNASGNDNAQSGILNVSGFRAAQSGNINIKMGMMAGEGDQDITGDYFAIKKRVSTNWETLRHGTNQTNNFFNSSVLITPNTKNPNYLNNYGFDIAMFDLDNTNNRLINNSQTSTSFKYGTAGDTFAIYNIVFAVDAYVPLVEAENKVTTPNISHGSEVFPEDIIDFQIDLKNKGSEAILDGALEISIPSTMHFVSASIDQSFPVKGTAVWSHPASTNPNLTAGGKITWVFDRKLTVGELEEIHGRINYSLQVSNDCTLLTSSVSDCILTSGVNGKVTGKGELSGHDFDISLVRGYTQGVCSAAQYDDLNLNITLTNDFLANCPSLSPEGAREFKVYCDPSITFIERNTIANEYPKGTKFYSQEPSMPGYETSLVTGDFPVDTQSTMYYAILPGMTESCYLRLTTFLEIVTTQPTVSDIEVCYHTPYTIPAALSNQGAQAGLELYYFDSPTSALPLASVPNPTEPGVYTYYVAEGNIGANGSCFGQRVAFTITINELPLVDDLSDFWELCPNADGVYSYNLLPGQTLVWQYALDSNQLVWSDLQPTSFNGDVLLPQDTQLVISHANSSIDKVHIRVKIINDKGCVNYSYKMQISIKACNAISNPTLPSKAGKSISN